MDSNSTVVLAHSSLGIFLLQGCDPPVDMVHCPGQTDTEYKTEFSLWCIMAAPLLVTTDVRNMTDIMKEV